MARSKTPRSRRGQPPSEPVVDPVDPDVTEPAVDERTPEPEPAPEPEPPIEEEAAPRRRGRQRKGADIQVTAKGDAESVVEALGRVGKTRAPAVLNPQAQEEEDENAIDEEEIMRLLSNPRNKVTVVRTFPKRWRGAKCDIQVDPNGYPCPVSFDDIKTDVFRRFGGKSFTAYIHPIGIMGRNRILAAVPFENPDMDDPIFELPQDETTVVDPRLLPIPEGGGDPTMVPDDDPMEGVERDIKRQTRITSRQYQLEQLKFQLEELRTKKKVVTDAPPQKGASVEDAMARMQAENNINRRIDQIEAAITRLAEQPQHPKSDGNDAIVRMLLAQQSSSDARFNTMMTAFMQMVTNQNKPSKEDSLDVQLDRLNKLKAALGPDDHRSKRIDDVLYDLMMDKLVGGNGDSEGGSDVRYAVDKLAPMVKSFVDKKLVGPPEEPSPTQEQFQAAVQKKATQVINDLIHQGKLTMSEKPAVPALPAPAHKVGAPQEKKPAPAAKAPEPAHEEPAQEEEADMDVPPGPKHPRYDRKTSVDFVLDSIIHDIDDNFPEESYIIGDALDCLDREILDKLLEVSSGEDLEKVVGPYCTQEKIQSIKDRGKNPRIKSWLTRVITTIQDEYRGILEKEAAAKAKA